MESWRRTSAGTGYELESNEKKHPANTRRGDHKGTPGLIEANQHYEASRDHP